MTFRYNFSPLHDKQSNLEEVLTQSLYKSHAHHETFSDFQQAVIQDCFVCVQLWGSIRSEVLANWKTGSAQWSPLKCSLSRRTWAPEWYDAIYWSFIYLNFDFHELDMSDVNYRGDVFCLLKWSNGRFKRAMKQKHIWLIAQRYR
jgi:hypothetical protein